MTALGIAAIAGGALVTALLVLVAGYFMGFSDGFPRGWNRGYEDRGLH
jgi:hypothetical protein